MDATTFPILHDADVASLVSMSDAIDAIEAALARKGRGEFVTPPRHYVPNKNGALVFTSDHGEAFLEHGEREHGGRPHDEKVRIPLLVHGAGLEPRDLVFGASLIDLAPTLCELAGVPGDPGWVGTSLFALDRERPLVAYNQDARGSYLAIVEGEKKLLTEGAAGERPAARFGEVYDLAQDPLERVNLENEAPGWSRALGEKCWPLWQAVDARVLAPTAVDVPEALRAELEALGYGGGGN